MNKKIVRVEGNTTIDKERLLHQDIVALRSWGKHFLIELPEFSLRVHFMLFGSYRINGRKSWANPRLSLGFDSGELNLYACSVRFIEEPLDLVYDWWADVMSEHWDPALARMEKAVRAEEALAGAHQAHLSALQRAVSKAHLGRTDRRSFFCENCQVRY